jgi:hypothetical protein
LVIFLWFPDFLRNIVLGIGGYLLTLIFNYVTKSVYGQIDLISVLELSSEIEESDVLSNAEL